MNRKERDRMNRASIPGIIEPQGYVLIEELPFDQLYTIYNNHRRLMTFANKGCKCVHPECEMVGTKLIKAAHWKFTSQIHVDLYAVDPNGKLVLMTVDHIIPKSLGGPDRLENYQPMCYIHNFAKGNKIQKIDEKGN